MRSKSVSVLCFFLFTAIYSLLSGQNAVVVSGISIYTNEDAEAIIRNEAQYKNLKRIDVSADPDSATLSRLIRVLSRVSLEDLRVSDYKGSFPFHDLRGLRTLKRLSFETVNEEDYDELMAAVSALALRSLELHVSETSMIPDNIVGLGGTDSVVVLSGEHGDSVRTKPERIVYTLGNRSDKKMKFVLLNFGGPLSDDERERLRAMMQLQKADVASSVNSVALFERKYKNVNPPLKTAVVPTEVFTVNAATGGTFVYEKSNTIIKVPENAFVDAKGKPVKGEVQVSYREYRTAEDILISGIPMKLNSEKEKGDMESAGMFELNAAVQGKEIFLNKNKKIELNIEPTDTVSKGYNFYSFNEKAGEWENNGKFGEDKVVQKEQAGPYVVNKNTDSTEIERISTATAVYRTFIGTPHKTFDSVPFAERFMRSDYDYTYNKKNPEKGPIIVSTKKRTVRRSKHNLVQISSVRKNRWGDILCRIKTIYKCHPEMSVFSGFKWKVNGFDSPAEFKAKLLSVRRYSDIRIEAGATGYVVKIKANGQIQQFDAEPVFTDKKDSVLESSKQAGRKFKQYERSLKLRERSFMKRLRKGTLEDNSFYDKEREKEVKELGYRRAALCMLKEEKEMSKEEWMNKGYITKVKVPRYETLTGGNRFYEDRRFTFGGIAGRILNAPRTIIQIATLGLFNMDKLYISPPQPRLFDAMLAFKNQQGEKLEVSRLYTVYKRGVVIENNPKQALTFRKNVKVGFMVFTADGRVAIRKYGSLDEKAELLNGELMLEATEPEKQITNPQQLKAYVDYKE